MQLCDAREKNSLEEELKKAAAARLGASLEQSMRPDDAEAYRTASNSMAAAIRKAKDNFDKRKAELGTEAALAELDEQIRGRDTGSRAD